MEELNTTLGVEVVAEDGYDPLTMVDLGDCVSLSQTSEDGDFHNIIISADMVAAVMAFLGGTLG